jgi:hypothetical protein
MEFGILVKFEKDSQPEGLLLHFKEEPTMAEVASLVKSSVVGGQPYSWQVHEVNRSVNQAADWLARQAA